MAQRSMYVVVAGFHSRSLLSALLCAALCGGCGDESDNFVSTGPDTSMAGSDEAEAPMRRCDRVEMDGEFVVEHEKDFTARFRVGEPYTKTVMLFGGELVEDENVFSNAYIFGLDKQDALMLAERYPDFYLCSSPGGQEASNYIVPYDLVPADCQIFEQIADALWQYDLNLASGGDRTSLRFDGAPLELVSVTANANGDDYTDQVAAMDHDFHLVTRVEQLTGESVLSFGTSQ